MVLKADQMSDHQISDMNQYIENNISHDFESTCLVDQYRGVCKSQHLHPDNQLCTDEAQKAETALFVVIYIYIIQKIRTR